MRRSPPPDEFAIPSIDELFWEFDARPVAERSIHGRCSLGHGGRVGPCAQARAAGPGDLRAGSKRSATDEKAVSAAIRASLHSASGPLKRVDPLSRQEKVAARLGIAFWFLSIVVSTAIDRVSEDVLAEGISLGIILVGWGALWRPAERFMVEVVPRVFNRRRFAELKDIEVRFVWV